jgi:hypothetical protein
MAGAGIFTLVLLLLAVPFVAVKEYFGKMRLLDPRSAALQKVSHGAAMLALGGWAFWLGDQIGLLAFGHWVPLALLGLDVFGLFWLVTGWNDAKIFGAQPGVDESLIFRAIAKAVVGLALFWLLGNGSQVLDREYWLLLVELQWPVRAVAVWCVISGAAKFAVLLAVKKRPPQRPPVHAMPHGEARFASPGEARRMQQGHGGSASRMDQRKF